MGGWISKDQEEHKKSSYLENYFFVIQEGTSRRIQIHAQWSYLFISLYPSVASGVASKLKRRVTIVPKTDGNKSKNDVCKEETNHIRKHSNNKG